ncbi:LysE family translocator [Anaeroselena agilis]|uniref:LysE family transporter n=1 Tax=Anaeroselena agilis TaxID=3063788 RepID=A0ABU3NXR6_9FIRM|nr:LysE family transporter [Selenomonadales bacterium 4137-cl]
MLALAGILLAVALGAMSPGPSFLFVARTSMAASRRSGLAAAAGMGVGGFAYAILALLGLKAVFAGFPWLYSLIKLGGGAYLVYIGIQMWRGAASPLADLPAADAVRNTRLRAFAMAAATQLSNPKTAVFYGSIFAALLPASPGPLFTILLPLAVFLIEIGWYSIVALLLSASAPRAAYMRAKSALDRTAGTVMGLLGVKLIAAADSGI